MKIRLGQLRQIIREELDFGKVIFAPERGDISTPVSEREPNTRQEQELYNSLKGWVREKIPFGHLESTILDAMNDPRYSDFFHPPPLDTPVYRGLHDVDWGIITDKFLTGNHNAEALEKADDAAGSGLGGYVSCDFMTENRGMTSWTRDLEVAKRFAVQKSSIPINIVLEALPRLSADAMFDLNAVQKEVPDLMFHPQIDEGEIIAFGPVRVTGIYFLPRETRRA